MFAAEWSPPDDMPGVIAWVPLRLLAPWGQAHVACAWAAELRDAELRTSTARALRTPAKHTTGDGAVPPAVLRTRQLRLVQRLERAQASRARALGLATPQDTSASHGKRSRAKAQTASITDVLPTNVDPQGVCSKLLGGMNPASSSIHQRLLAGDTPYRHAVTAAVQHVTQGILDQCSRTIVSSQWSAWLSGCLASGRPGADQEGVVAGEGAGLILSEASSDGSLGAGPDSEADSDHEEPQASERPGKARRKRSQGAKPGGQRGGAGGGDSSDDSLYGDPVTPSATSTAHDGAPSRSLGPSHHQRLQRLLQSRPRRPLKVARKAPKPTPTDASGSSDGKTKTKVSNEAIRAKARTMLAGAVAGAKLSDAIIEVLPHATSTPVAGVSLPNLRKAVELANAAEAAMHAKYPLSSARNKYKEQLLAMTLNLQDPSNPTLRQRVMSGDLPPERLGTMSTLDMASAEVQATRASITAEGIQAAGSAAPSRPVPPPDSSGKTASDKDDKPKPKAAPVATPKPPPAAKKRVAPAKTSVLSSLIKRTRIGPDTKLPPVTTKQPGTAQGSGSLPAERPASLGQDVQANAGGKSTCSLAVVGEMPGVPKTVTATGTALRHSARSSSVVASALARASEGTPTPAGRTLAQSLFSDVAQKYEAPGYTVDVASVQELHRTGLPPALKQVGRMRLEALGSYLLDIHTRMQRGSRALAVFKVDTAGEGVGALCTALASAGRAGVFDVADSADINKGTQVFVIPPITALAREDSGTTSLARLATLPQDTRGLFCMLLSAYSLPPASPAAVLRRAERVHDEDKPPKTSRSDPTPSRESPAGGLLDRPTAPAQAAAAQPAFLVSTDPDPHYAPAGTGGGGLLGAGPTQPQQHGNRGSRWGR
ncbi:Tcea3 [Symbiodinium sp. KB8]|nr:Tcea3 [Symbiodinium sp. KB8]